MKNYIKGIITGIIIGAVICSLPAMAQTLDALFNHVRININGIDEIQWDEDITLADGSKTSSSILYNGTTYLPMRKLGELNGNEIYWNGDSRTVGMTGKQKNESIITEKSDKNGNLWQYYTFEDANNFSYLGVKDEARGYERTYRITGNVKVTEDEIYFIRLNGSSYPRRLNGGLVKLSFANDADSQDGEMIKEFEYISSGGILNDGYVYYMLHIPGNASHSELWVYNYLTGDEALYRTSAWNTLYLTDVKETDSDITFEYKCDYMGHDMEADSKVYDKATNEFK